MTRKILFGAATLALLVAGFGVASFPALAELRIITITLEGGQEVVTTVDVPPGTPPEAIQLPEISAPVKKVEDGGPPQPKNPADDAQKKEPKDKSKKDEESSPGEFLEENEPAKPERKKRKKTKPGDIRTPDGAPTADNPTLTLGLPGPAPVGVPNFVISKFRIPPFLLPIYQAAGTQYGIRWEVLAAINEIETDYGRNLNVSSAGALGWMQFIPSSWRSYGTDANRDGEKDPYNPVDAIFAAARYLKAAGAEKDLRRAIFAYNHADWYVDSVMLRARLISGLPADLVGSLTGLTQGHFPVHARARYADDLAERDLRRLGKKTRRSHNAARIVDSNDRRRSINIYSRRGAPVIAVNDGVVRKIGKSSKLGRFIVLQDVYGNRYTYAHLGKVSRRYPVPKTFDDPRARDEFRYARQPREEDLPKPTAPASAGTQTRDSVTKRAAYRTQQLEAADPSATGTPAQGQATEKERLFANPARPSNREVAEETGQLLDQAGFEVFKVYFSKTLRLKPSEIKLKTLKKGSRVIGGTVLGRVGKVESGPGSKLAPHLNFSIRPAGRGAPRIDPKPILDGWKLLEATAIYRAAGRNPFVANPGVGQVLLMSKEALTRRVLADQDIGVYECGRDDIRSGQVDRRVLATLEFLAASGLRPTVTSLKCGHGVYTKSGNVSHHSSGNAVDIAKINDIPILGHQGRGEITEVTVRKLMTLQGAMQPAQIISLLDLGSNTLAMGDHADHIHVGFRPLFGPNQRLGRQARRLLSNNQWDRFVDRLTNIENPVVRTTPSKYSIRVKRRGSGRRSSHAHVGE
jgi:transglycosylase-like protein with SLT domain/peptidase M23-like protein